MCKTVWYISKYFAPQTVNSPGGRGYLLMREIARLGYRPVVITSDSNNLIADPQLTKKLVHQEIESIEIIWLKTIKYSTAKSLKRILSWFHFEWNLFKLNDAKLPSPDVIIVSSLSLLTIFNGLLLKRVHKCRLVFEIRDIWPLTIVEEGGFSVYNPFVMFLQYVEKLGYKKSDIIIGTMPNLLPHVENVLGYSRPVYCLPMGIDQDSLGQNVEVNCEYRERFLNSDKFTIVHAGTIGITNALETFFQAAVAMKDDDDIEFLIVGDGALKDEYIKSYGYLPNVTFAEKVDKNMVQSVLSFCDLLYLSVHKSKVWEYGQSLNKVIDYMYAGKPIIASYTGYPSMINEAECGVFIPSEDVEALVSAINNYRNMSRSERDRIGGRGREWIVSNRNYKKLANDYLALLFDNN